MALQRGTIDGFMSASDGVWASKLHKIAKYCFNTGFGTSSWLLAASKAHFDALLPADQKALLQIAQEETDKMTQWVLSVGDKEYKAKEKAEGATFYAPPANMAELATKAGQKNIDTYLERTGPKGKELYDKMMAALAPYK